MSDQREMAQKWAEMLDRPERVMLGTAGNIIENLWNTQKRDNARFSNINCSPSGMTARVPGQSSSGGCSSGFDAVVDAYHVALPHAEMWINKKH